MGTSARKVLTALGRAALDMLFPPVCLGCGGAVGTPHGLCPTCWSQLVPITRPYCPVLGLPFAADLGPEIVSAKALAEPPVFDRARSAVVYTDRARQLISRMKYGDRPDIARMCAGMMAGAGGDLLGPDAVLVPVPLHRLRQFQRRYNQSTELARGLAALSGLPVVTDLVHRHRQTAQQVGMNARQRARNVAGAFRVKPGRMAGLAGRRIILVDDVYTTGATVAALALALRRAGAHHVDVLTFARVVINADMTV